MNISRSLRKYWRQYRSVNYRQTVLFAVLVMILGVIPLVLVSALCTLGFYILGYIIAVLCFVAFTFISLALVDKAGINFKLIPALPIIAFLNCWECILVYFIWIKILPKMF